MKEIVNLTVRGRISENEDNGLTLNGNSLGKMLGAMLCGEYISSAVLTIKIQDAAKGEESDETI